MLLHPGRAVLITVLIYLVIAYLLVSSIEAAPRAGHQAHVTKHGSFVGWSGSVLGYPKGARVRICGVETGRCGTVVVRDVWHPAHVAKMEYRNNRFDLGKAAYETICGISWETVEPYWACHARIAQP